MPPPPHPSSRRPSGTSDPAQPSRQAANRIQQSGLSLDVHGIAPGFHPSLGVQAMRPPDPSASQTYYGQLQAQTRAAAINHQLQLQQQHQSQYMQNAGPPTGTLDKMSFTPSQNTPTNLANEQFDPNFGDQTLNWDWGDVNLDPSTAFGDSYEPQGELLQLFENQQQQQVPPPPPQAPAVKQEFNLPHQGTVVQARSETAFQNSPMHTAPSGAPASAAPSVLPSPASHHPSVKVGMKRKSHSEASPTAPSSAGVSEDAESPPAKRPAKVPASGGGSAGRRNTVDRVDANPEGKESDIPTEDRNRDTPHPAKPVESGPTTTQPRRPRTVQSGDATPDIAPGIPGVMRTVIGDARRPSAKSTLPQEKVFPIQIGSELFRLSGASIASDAPSYFSQFFEEQLRNHADDAGGVRTLYIDRDPVTFKDISLHLQGYYIYPKDGLHFVKLFADAQFYSLPRLISQLFESEIYMHIGEQPFRIPRDIFSSPGDSPNFFTLGFHIFFTTPKEVFPGLDGKGLLRPPAIMPPSVPHRSASVFRDLLHILRGYPVHINSEEHRSELLRDCRYFHLRGLEQKLIPHNISYNLRRQRSEIVIRLEDIRQSGITFCPDSQSISTLTPGTPVNPASTTGWVQYARPFVDDSPHDLILELSSSECHTLDLSANRADFHGDAKKRISVLFQVIANKMNLPTTQPLGLMMLSTGGGVAALPASPGNTPLSEDRVRIRIDSDTDIIVNGQPYDLSDDAAVDYASTSDSVPIGAQPLSRNSSEAGGSAPYISGVPSPATRTRSPLSGSRPPLGRQRQGTEEVAGEWIARKGQWRLRVQSTPDGRSVEVVLVAVKLDVLTSEKARNKSRAFLV